AGCSIESERPRQSCCRFLRGCRPVRPEEAMDLQRIRFEIEIQEHALRWMDNAGKSCCNDQRGSRRLSRAKELKLHLARVEVGFGILHLEPADRIHQNL